MSHAMTLRFRSSSKRETELYAALQGLPRGVAGRLVVQILKEVFWSCDTPEGLSLAMQELSDYPDRLTKYAHRASANHEAILQEGAASDVVGDAPRSENTQPVMQPAATKGLLAVSPK